MKHTTTRDTCPSPDTYVPADVQPAAHVYAPDVVLQVLMQQGVQNLPGSTGEDRGFVQADPGTVVGEYWLSCMRFWAKLDRRREPGAWVATRRKIAVHKQGTREDLKAAYDALRAVPVVGNVVDFVLAEPRTSDDLLKVATELNAKAVDIGNGMSQYVLMCPKRGWANWDDELGGPISPGEQAREIVVTVGYAKWRDRRLRRLVGVQAYAHELWPRHESFVN